MHGLETDLPVQKSNLESVLLWCMGCLAFDLCVLCFLISKLPWLKMPGRYENPAIYSAKIGVRYGNLESRIAGTLVAGQNTLQW